MSETTTNLVERYLINKLECFYGKHYPAGQRIEIIKRFTSLTEVQIVTLYDNVVGACARMPMLSELLTIYDRKPASPVGNYSASPNAGAMPWVEREKKAHVDSAAYTARMLDDEWSQAVAEGWRSEARDFLAAWAYNQSYCMQGGTNYGVLPAHLGLGSGMSCDLYDERMSEMKESIRTAKMTGDIHVPMPQWIIDYGRSEAARKFTAIPPPQHAAHA